MAGLWSNDQTVAGRILPARCRRQSDLRRPDRRFAALPAATTTSTRWTSRTRSRSSPTPAGKFDGDIVVSRFDYLQGHPAQSVRRHRHGLGLHRHRPHRAARRHQLDDLRRARVLAAHGQGRPARDDFRLSRRPLRAEQSDLSHDDMVRRAGLDQPALHARRRQDRDDQRPGCRRSGASRRTGSSRSAGAGRDWRAFDGYNLSTTTTATGATRRNPHHHGDQPADLNASRSRPRRR